MTAHLYNIKNSNCTQCVMVKQPSI